MPARDIEFLDPDMTDPRPPARCRRRFVEGNLALTALIVLPVGFAVITAALVAGLLGVLALFGLFP